MHSLATFMLRVFMQQSGHAAALLLTAVLLGTGSVNAQSLSSQIEQQSAQQYQAMMQEAASKGALAPESSPELQRLRRIAQRILPKTYAYNESARNWQWEVNLIGSDQINAFCMPGGKIAFYTGILRTLNLTDDEVAIVMGHEITHALREHGVGQYKKQAYGEIAASVGGALLSQWLGINADLTNMAAQGLKQVALLKYSRKDETDADLIGLELAASAGFDPRAGVALWQKMEQASKGAPPQWLSSHPAGSNRIKEMQGRMNKMLPVYAAAIGKSVDQLPAYQTTAIGKSAQGK